MSESVHGNSSAAPMMGPPAPNVHDGYNDYIKTLLAPVTGENEGMDFFQAQAGAGEHKKPESLLHKVLKWSGIAFAVFMGGSILKKLVMDYMEPAAEKGIEKAVSEGAEKAVKAVASPSAAPAA